MAICGLRTVKSVYRMASTFCLEGGCNRGGYTNFLIGRIVELECGLFIATCEVHLML